MTRRKNRALQVPLLVPYKELEKFSKALYEEMGDTCSARFFRSVMFQYSHMRTWYCLNYETTKIMLLTVEGNTR